MIISTPMSSHCVAFRVLSKKPLEINSPHFTKTDYISYYKIWLKGLTTKLIFKK